MKITESGGDIEFDAGRWVMIIEDWAKAGSVRLVTKTRTATGSLVFVGALFLDRASEVQALARSVIGGFCPPAILADWIQEHPECWRCPSAERERAAEVICKRLRQC